MANVPISNITTTWDNLATTFTGVKLNVIDTASASGSMLMDLQVGGTSIFSVAKSGRVYIVEDDCFIDRPTSNTLAITAGGALSAQFKGNSICTTNTGLIGFLATASSAGSFDTGFFRDGSAGIIAQRNAANAQTFRIYNTYTDATNTFERGKIAWESDVLRIGTEKGVTGGLARALELQTDGTTRLTIASDGVATFHKNVFVSAGNALFQDGFNESLKLHASYGIAWQAGGVTDGTSNTTRLTQTTSPSYGVELTVGVRLGAPALHTTNGYTVATLPTSAAGMIARVTDGDSGLTFGNTVVNSGAGATPYLCWYNGTNWTVIGA